MRIKIIKTLFLLLFSISIITAQVSPGARQVALSHSTTALANDIFSVFNNPAGLAQLNWREFGIYYSPSPFGLTELANAYAAYLEPFSFGNIAAGYALYGFELYKESKIALSFSRRIGQNFFLGITTLYQSLSIKNYGNDKQFIFNLGGLAYLNPDTRIGFYINNLFRGTYGTIENQIPFTLGAGVSYDFNYNIILNAGLEKELDFDPSFRFGIEYNPIKYISLRTGFMNEPSSYSFGIGIHYSYFSLDYAAFTHQDLGLTHQAGIIIDFNSLESRTESIKKYLFSEK